MFVLPFYNKRMYILLISKTCYFCLRSIHHQLR